MKRTKRGGRYVKVTGPSGLTAGKEKSCRNGKCTYRVVRGGRWVKVSKREYDRTRLGPGMKGAFQSFPKLFKGLNRGMKRLDLGMKALARGMKKPLSKKPPNARCWKVTKNKTGWSAVAKGGRGCPAKGATMRYSRGKRGSSVVFNAGRRVKRA